VRDGAKAESRHRRHSAALRASLQTLRWERPIARKTGEAALRRLARRTVEEFNCVFKGQLPTHHFDEIADKTQGA
jgi:hypothetical protein